MCSVVFMVGTTPTSVAGTSRRSQEARTWLISTQASAEWRLQIAAPLGENSECENSECSIQNGAWGGGGRATLPVEPLGSSELKAEII